MVEITAETKDVLWSEHPSTDYITEYKGYSMGLGAHPGILANKGIWNLVWLLTPKEVLDTYHNQKPDNTLSMTTEDTPYIIGTAWQMINSTSLVATAALKLTPLEFLDEVLAGGRFESMILTKRNPNWIDDCMPTALSYSARHLKNIVRVNFGGKR